jgi:hypothetical protein
LPHVACPATLWHSVEHVEAELWWIVMKCDELWWIVMNCDESRKDQKRSGKQLKRCNANRRIQQTLFHGRDLQGSAAVLGFESRTHSARRLLDNIRIPKALMMWFSVSEMGLFDVVWTWCTPTSTGLGNFGELWDCHGMPWYPGSSPIYWTNVSPTCGSEESISMFSFQHLHLRHFLSRWVAVCPSNTPASDEIMPRCQQLWHLGALTHLDPTEHGFSILFSTSECLSRVFMLFSSLPPFSVRSPT